ASSPQGVRHHQNTSVCCSTEWQTVAPRSNVARPAVEPVAVEKDRDRIIEGHIMLFIIGPCLSRVPLEHQFSIGIYRRPAGDGVPPNLESAHASRIGKWGRVLCDLFDEPVTKATVSKIARLTRTTTRMRMSWKSISKFLAR